MKLLLNAGWDESLPSDKHTNVAKKASSGGVPHAPRAKQGVDGEDDADADAAKDDKDNKSTTTTIPEILPDVDAILLCDSTLPSLGGLPRYFGASKVSKRGRAPRPLSVLPTTAAAAAAATTTTTKKQRNPPFLATYPTVKMGQMTLYDHHASLSLDGCHPGYSLEDVDAVFSKDSFHTLKYSQTVYLPLESGDDGYVAGDDVDINDGNVNGDGTGMDINVDTTTSTTIHVGTKQTLGHSKSSKKLVAITPHLSGHVVGGCYWVLRQLSDDTEIILAPTYHHAKERHLAGSTLHKFGVNADALLTTCGGPRGLLGKLYQPPPPPPSPTTKKKDLQKQDKVVVVKYNKGNKPILSPPMGNQSESALLESIMAALRRDGNVLLPVDASGRVLELLLILDKHWGKQRLSGAYNLVWVAPMSFNTIEFARSQLEWMAPPLGAQFDSQRGHPYALKHIKVCSAMSELENVIERSGGNPTCVLASGATLDHGPARDLLIKWGSNPDNLVAITDSTRCVPRGDVWFDRMLGGSEKDKTAQAQKEEAINRPVVPTEAEQGETDEDGNLLGAPISPTDVSAYTTSSQLLYAWCTAKASKEEMADEVSVDIYVPHRAPLAGNELKAFLAEEEEERRMKQKEAEQKAMMMEIELARGRLRLGDDETDKTAGGKAGASGGGVGSKAKKATGTGGAASSRPKKKSRFDQSLFIKFSKPVHSE